MLATHRPRWLDRGPESNWSGFAFSVAITIGLFAAAFIAMNQVPQWTASSDAIRELPAVVRLEWPRAKPIPAPRPAARVMTSAVSPPSAAPPTVPSVVVPQAPVRQPDTTGTGTATSEVAPTAGANNRATTLRLGAPIAPAGVTRARAGNEADSRDSLARRIGRAVSVWDWHGPPSPAEVEELRETRRMYEGVTRRATTAGNASDIHVMTGEGRGGVGAVGGGKSGLSPTGGSIPLPLFSSGPSSAQRKRDSAIDADNQARLRRLRERIVWRADSARLDSLRRDSLHRDSLAKPGRPPIS